MSFLKNLAILICAFYISGCSYVISGQNSFYHRFSLKPLVVEEELVGPENKCELVVNPYDVKILVALDCEEKNNHQFILEPNSVVTLYVKSKYAHVCSIAYWHVVEATGE